MKRNWAREIAAVAPTASILVLEGGNAVPERFPEWTIINYDILARHLEALARATWAGIVFDEAHYLKNHTSARSRVGANSWTERRRARRRAGQGSRPCIC